MTFALKRLCVPAVVLTLAAPCPAVEVDAFDQGPSFAREAQEQFLANISPESIGTLAAALTHEKDRVRLWAAKTLGEIPERAPRSARQAQEHLKRALADRSLSVRAAAARALADLGDPSGEPALIEALSGTDPAAQALALDALGRVGGKPCVGALIGTLSHPDPEIGRMAFWTLVRITGQSFGQSVLCASPLPDFNANPEYQRVVNAVLDLGKALEEVPPANPRKEALEQDLKRMKEQKRHMVCDLMAQGRVQRMVQVERAVLQWTEWFAGQKDGDALQWLLEGVAAQPEEIALAAAQGLTRASTSSQIPRLLEAASQTRLAPKVRAAIVRAAAGALDDATLAAWIDFVEKTAQELAAAETEERDNWYPVLDAATRALSERTGHGAQLPTDWKAWAEQARKVPGFRLGRVLFVAVPGPGGTAQIAVQLPEPPAGADIPVTLSRWNLPEARWESRAAAAVPGRVLGDGPFATGLTLTSIRHDPRERSDVYTFKDAEDNVRTFHAR